MKFTVLIAAVGAFAVFVVPAMLLDSGSGVFHGFVEHLSVAQIRFRDLDPLREKTMTAKEPGFHPSPAMPVAIAPPQSLSLNLGQSFDPQAQTEIGGNNRHLHDMQADMHDPAHWLAPSPN